MQAGFVSMSVLEIENQGLKRRIDSFESGSAYQKLKDELNRVNRINAQLHEEIERLKRENAENTRKWMEVNEDVEKEKEKELEKKDREIERLREEIEKLKGQKEDLKAEKQKALEEKKAAEAALADATEKIAGLNARLNKDSTNSSKPSSTDPNHPKQQNSRERSGRKPGAQPEHEHHGRKYLVPTSEPCVIPTPAEFLDPTRYRATGEIVRKQLVSAHIVVEVQEFQAVEYRNIETGQIVHADFPFGLKDDVTYASSVKSLAFLLNNRCNVSIGNTRDFLSDASGNILTVSSGFICQLTKKFSELSEPEQRAAWAELANAEVFHIDFTFGRAAGKSTTVAVTCDDNNTVVYEAKEKKGHEGVKGTPAEVNQGICVSDHEASLIHLGSAHQECLAHVGREAKGSVENEPKLTWNKKLCSFAYDTIRYRESMQPGEDFDPETVADLEKTFYEAIETGRQEYKDNPPTKYYRDGYNLWKRISEKPDDYLLTLHDLRVPPTNNIAERCGRKYKRKVKQMMTFRSTKYHTYYCNTLTSIERLRKKGGNLFENVAAIFDRSTASSTTNGQQQSA